MKSKGEGARFGADSASVDAVAPFGVGHATASVVVEGGHFRPLVVDGGIDKAIEIRHHLPGGIRDIPFDLDVFQSAQGVRPRVDRNGIDLAGPHLGLGVANWSATSPRRVKLRLLDDAPEAG